MSSNFGPESDVTAPPPQTLDTFIAKLGNPGRYQIVVMLLLSTNYIPVVINHILMAFYSAHNNFHCKVPEGADRSLYIPLADKSYTSAPLAANTSNSREIGTLDSCLMYVDPSDHSQGSTACQDGYEFEFGYENEWTITAEWGLVCDRAFLSPLITTTYFCGVMIGGVIFGSLSDRFGRKSMMLVCLYTQCIIGLGIHFAQGLMLFIGLRFIQGIFIQGLQCITYSMVMELFPPGWRTLAGCVVEAFWAGGIVLLAVIARYVQHWRYIQLAINIPTVATVFYIWIIPESLRWLISKGKLDRAESIVTSILGYNSLDLDISSLRTEMESLVQRDQGNLGNLESRGNTESLVRTRQRKRSPGITDILRVPTLRLRSLVLFFIWFSVSLCYYGITYYIPNLYGDRYLNMILSGGVELAAYIAAFVVLGGFGRQGPLCVYLSMSGLICIAVISVRSYVPEDVMDTSGLIIGLTLLGKAMIVSCFCTIFIYSSEIFPTLIRTVGVGSCTFFGRVGSLLAPQVLLAGEYMYAERPALVPFLVFGSLCLVSALLALLLPETLDRDLPDTLQDAVVQGAPEHHSSDESLDVGYGKCPEFVVVDGLIVSRESGDWREVQRESGDWRDNQTDTEQSFVSVQGTLTTTRSRRSSRTEPDYEIIPEKSESKLEPNYTSKPESYAKHGSGGRGSDRRLLDGRGSDGRGMPLPNSYASETQLSNILRKNSELLSSSRDLLGLQAASLGLHSSNLGLPTSSSNPFKLGSQGALASQDSSVVSAEHSLVFNDPNAHPTHAGQLTHGQPTYRDTNETKDILVAAMLKEKLLVLDSNNETRL